MHEVEPVERVLEPVSEVQERAAGHELGALAREDRDRGREERERGKGEPYLRRLRHDVPSNETGPREAIVRAHAAHEPRRFYQNQNPPLKRNRMTSGSSRSMRPIAYGTMQPQRVQSAASPRTHGPRGSPVASSANALRANAQVRGEPT